MPLSESRRKARAKLASATARADRDPRAAESLDELRREYRFLTAAEYVKELVDEAPPLSVEQRDRLALLLRGGAAA